MFCQYCGKQIDDGLRYCVYCGKDQFAVQQDAQQDAQQWTQQDSQQATQQDAQQATQQDAQQWTQQDAQQWTQQDAQQGVQGGPVGNTAEVGGYVTPKPGMSLAAKMVIVAGTLAVVGAAIAAIVVFALPKMEGGTQGQQASSDAAPVEVAGNEQKGGNDTNGTGGLATESGNASGGQQSNGGSAKSDSSGSSAKSDSSGSAVKSDSSGDAAKGETVTLSVTTADGSKLSGTVRKDKNGYVIADSSSKEYSLEAIRALNLSDAELCIAWNEPFARQGYHFKNPDLRAYFEACSWYVDTGNSSDLSGAGSINNSRLKQVASERPNGDRWKDLATK